MKRIVSLILSAAMLLSLTACGGTSTESKESVTETVAETEAPIEKQPSQFDGYVSNTAVSTGSHYLLRNIDTVTYRSYYPLEEYGTLEYKFYFSNTVDATMDTKGRFGYAGMPGGAYQIISASIADGGTSPEDPVSNVTAVTFDSSATKDVASGETYWSDSVTIDIPEGHYLVWEWTISGTDIPSLQMSNIAHSYYSKNGGQFIFSNEAPAPQFIGCKRDVKLKIATIGDSITQGCETTEFANNFWVSQLSETLGSDYAFWNLGIGSAKASDAALCGDWLERAKSADIVTVAFGTNDLLAGPYGGTGGSTAEEIEAWLRTILTELKNAGCKVILFNAPPYNMEGDAEANRIALNEKLPALAEEMGVEFFDFASLLSDPADPATARYGGHPNDEGCQIIADAFLEQFGDLLQTE